MPLDVAMTDALVDRLLAGDPEAQRSDVRVVHAPGRVNLIGEHTDYNDGLVLPAAIDLGITLALLPTDDRTVAITIPETGEQGTFDLDDPGPADGSWIDYVRGTARALGEAGVDVAGFRGILASDLPAGAGLSSSAALELASAWALCGGDRPPLEPMRLAQAAQRAENAYVGVASGLMDQFAVAFGQADHALLLDCRSLEHRAVSLPADVRLVVCHSGAPRTLAGSAYNERRADCERAVAGIAAGAPGVRSLRDVDAGMLEAARERLDDVAYRRARHVVTENARVVATIEASDAGDLAAVGAAFAASHASLRDDFEVSSPALDALVGIARTIDGVLGARLTGAGFGGCTINLARPDAVADLRAAVLADYPRMTGLTPRVFEVRAADGARRIV